MNRRCSVISPVAVAVAVAFVWLMAVAPTASFTSTVTTRARFGVSPTAVAFQAGGDESTLMRYASAGKDNVMDAFDRAMQQQQRSATPQQPPQTPQQQAQQTPPQQTPHQQAQQQAQQQEEERRATYRTIPSGRSPDQEDSKSPNSDGGGGGDGGANRFMDWLRGSSPNEQQEQQQQQQAANPVFPNPPNSWSNGASVTNEDPSPAQNHDTRADTIAQQQQQQQQHFSQQTQVPSPSDNVPSYRSNTPLSSLSSQEAAAMSTTSSQQQASQENANPVIRSDYVTPTTDDSFSLNYPPPPNHPPEQTVGVQADDVVHTMENGQEDVMEARIRRSLAESMGLNVNTPQSTPRENLYQVQEEQIPPQQNLYHISEQQIPMSPTTPSMEKPYQVQDEAPTPYRPPPLFPEIAAAFERAAGKTTDNTQQDMPPSAAMFLGQRRNPSQGPNPIGNSMDTSKTLFPEVTSSWERARDQHIAGATKPPMRPEMPPPPPKRSSRKNANAIAPDNQVTRIHDPPPDEEEVIHKGAPPGGGMGQPPPLIRPASSMEFPKAQEEHSRSRPEQARPTGVPPGYDANTMGYPQEQAYSNYPQEATGVPPGYDPSTVGYVQEQAYNTYPQEAVGVPPGYDTSTAGYVQEQAYNNYQQDAAGAPLGYDPSTSGYAQEDQAYNNYPQEEAGVASYPQEAAGLPSDGTTAAFSEEQAYDYPQEANGLPSDDSTASFSGEQEYNYPQEAASVSTDDDAAFAGEQAYNYPQDDMTASLSDKQAPDYTQEEAFSDEQVLDYSEDTTGFPTDDATESLSEGQTFDYSDETTGFPTDESTEMLSEGQTFDYSDETTDFPTDESTGRFSQAQELDYLDETTDFPTDESMGRFSEGQELDYPEETAGFLTDESTEMLSEGQELDYPEDAKGVATDDATGTFVNEEVPDFPEEDTSIPSNGSTWIEHMPDFPEAASTTSSTDEVAQREDRSLGYVEEEASSGFSDDYTTSFPEEQSFDLSQEDDDLLALDSSTPLSDYSEEADDVLADDTTSSFSSDETAAKTDAFPEEAVVGIPEDYPKSSSSLLALAQLLSSQNGGDALSEAFGSSPSPAAETTYPNPEIDDEDSSAFATTKEPENLGVGSDDSRAAEQSDMSPLSDTINSDDFDELRKDPATPSNAEKIDSTVDSSRPFTDPAEDAAAIAMDTDSRDTSPAEVGTSSKTSKGGTDAVETVADSSGSRTGDTTPTDALIRPLVEDSSPDLKTPGSTTLESTLPPVTLKVEGVRTQTSSEGKTMKSSARGSATPEVPNEAATQVTENQNSGPPKVPASSRAGEIQNTRKEENFGSAEVARPPTIGDRDKSPNRAPAGSESKTVRSAGGVSTPLSAPTDVAASSSQRTGNQNSVFPKVKTGADVVKRSSRRTLNRSNECRFPQQAKTVDSTSPTTVSQSDMKTTASKPSKSRVDVNTETVGSRAGESTSMNAAAARERTMQNQNSDPRSVETKPNAVEYTIASPTEPGAKISGHGSVRKPTRTQESQNSAGSNVRSIGSTARGSTPLNVPTDVAAAVARTMENQNAGSRKVETSSKAVEYKRPPPQAAGSGLNPSNAFKPQVGQTSGSPAYGSTPNIPTGASASIGRSTETQNTGHRVQANSNAGQFNSGPSSGPSTSSTLRAATASGQGLKTIGSTAHGSTPLNVPTDVAAAIARTMENQNTGPRKVETSSNAVEYGNRPPPPRGPTSSQHGVGPSPPNNSVQNLKTIGSTARGSTPLSVPNDVAAAIARTMENQNSGPRKVDTASRAVEYKNEPHNSRPETYGRDFTRTSPGFHGSPGVPATPSSTNLKTIGSTARGSTPLNVPTDVAAAIARTMENQNSGPRKVETTSNAVEYRNSPPTENGFRQDGIPAQAPSHASMRSNTAPSSELKTVGSTARGSTPLNVPSAVAEAIARTMDNQNSGPRKVATNSKAVEYQNTSPEVANPSGNVPAQSASDPTTMRPPPSAQQLSTVGSTARGSTPLNVPSSVAAAIARTMENQNSGPRKVASTSAVDLPTNMSDEQATLEYAASLAAGPPPAPLFPEISAAFEKRTGTPAHVGGNTRAARAARPPGVPSDAIEKGAIGSKGVITEIAGAGSVGAGIRLRRPARNTNGPIKQTGPESMTGFKATIEKGTGTTSRSVVKKPPTTSGLLTANAGNRRGPIRRDGPESITGTIQGTISKGAGTDSVVNKGQSPLYRFNGSSIQRQSAAALAKATSADSQDADSKNSTPAATLNASNYTDPAAGDNGGSSGASQSEKSLLDLLTIYEADTKGVMDLFDQALGIQGRPKSTKVDSVTDFRIEDSWPFLKGDVGDPKLPARISLNATTNNRAVAFRCLNYRGTIANGKSIDAPYNFHWDLTRSNSTSAGQILEEQGGGYKSLKSVNEIKQEILNRGPVVSTSFHLTRSFLETCKERSSFVPSLVGGTQAILIVGWKRTPVGEMWLVRSVLGDYDIPIAIGQFSIEDKVMAPKRDFVKEPLESPEKVFELFDLPSDWRSWKECRIPLENEDRQKELSEACGGVSLANACMKGARVVLRDGDKKGRGRAALLNGMLFSHEEKIWYIPVTFCDMNE